MEAEKRAAVLEMTAGGMSVTRAAQLAGVSRATAYRIVAEAAAVSETPDEG